MINKPCIHHKQTCSLICTFNKCTAGQILCDKCTPEHTTLHPKQFIYHIDNLSEIHGFNKVSKLKDILVAQKLSHESKITEIYHSVGGLLDPLIKRLHKFEE